MNVYGPPGWEWFDDLSEDGEQKELQSHILKIQALYLDMVQKMIKEMAFEMITNESLGEKRFPVPDFQGVKPGNFEGKSWANIFEDTRTPLDLMQRNYIRLERYFRLIFSPQVPSEGAAVGKRKQKRRLAKIKK